MKIALWKQSPPVQIALIVVTSLVFVGGIVAICLLAMWIHPDPKTPQQLDAETRLLQAQTLAAEQYSNCIAKMVPTLTAKLPNEHNLAGQPYIHSITDFAAKACNVGGVK